MALVACPSTARPSQDSKATREEIRSLGRNRRRTVITIHSVVGDVSRSVGELQNQAKNKNPCGGGARWTIVQ